MLDYIHSGRNVLSFACRQKGKKMCKLTNGLNDLVRLAKECIQAGATEAEIRKKLSSWDMKHEFFTVDERHQLSRKLGDATADVCDPRISLIQKMLVEWR
jgi:fatty acid-binding protein DegV